MEKHEILIESVTSSLIAIYNEINNGDIKKNDPEIRAEVRASIDYALENLKQVTGDETGWLAFKGKMLYDVYLEMRQSDRTLSNFDLIRPGLFKSDFSSPDEYYKHMGRVLEAKAAEPTKVCNKCRRTLPESKFTRRRGATCNACKCAARRANKKEAGNEQTD